MLRLENAHDAAKAAWWKAKRNLERKRSPANAKAAYDAALAEMRRAGDERFAFEMAATKIVDVATLPVNEFWRAMLAAHVRRSP
jgi:hypothetical protein